MNIALSPSLIRLSAGALAATAALLATGCGSSSSSHTQVPTVSLSRAAYVSSAATGYKVAFTLHETVPSIGRIDGTGTGSFSPASRLGALNLNMSPPQSAGTGPLQLQMVLDRTTFYMKLPPQLSSLIPGGKPWVYVNLDKAGQAAGISGLGGLYNSSSSLTDPGRYLNYLRAASAGTVKDVGQENVNGVPTRHYSAKLDMAKLPDVVPASERRSAQQLVTVLEHKGVTTLLPIQVWIDSSKLVRRIQMAFSEPLASESVSISLTENFVQYGPQAAPAIPSAGESTNLLSVSHTSG